MSKLVRDNIPDIIKQHGGSPKTHIASDIEYKKKLFEKLQEEVQEFLSDENPEELADIQEVLQAIYQIYHLTSDTVETLQRKKAKARGSFSKKIILEE